MPDITVDLASSPSGAMTATLPLVFPNTFLSPVPSRTRNRTVVDALLPTTVTTILPSQAATRVRSIAVLRTQAAPVVLTLRQTAVTIDVGDEIRLMAEWSAGGTTVDPTLVQLIIRLPDNTLVTRSYVDGQPQIIRPDRGAYYSDYAPTISGVHHYRWVGTSPAMAAEEGQFLVRASNVVVT